MRDQGSSISASAADLGVVPSVVGGLDNHFQIRPGLLGFEIVTCFVHLLLRLFYEIHGLLVSLNRRLRHEVLHGNDSMFA